MNTQAGDALLEFDPIIALLLEGTAQTTEDAEEIYLDAHVADVVRLVESSLSDAEFRRHPLIALLLSHGSRAAEDSPW